MKDRKNKRGFNRNKAMEESFRCDNIFKATHSQPYLDSTEGGKWGRGKDDSPVNDDEYPDINNPLPR